MSENLRTDVYQNHQEPDAPQTEPGRMDSAVDVALAAAALTEHTDKV